MSEWVEIPRFPKYSVNNLGQVRKNSNGRLVRPRINRTGGVYVGLVHDFKQYNRSLPLIVAKLFLEPPRWESFDTPIHLDGDKFNCTAANLMWRPRWFAIKYHRQFKEGLWAPLQSPVRDLETEEVFSGPLAVSTRYGLLEIDVVLGIGNDLPVWPINHRFEWANN